MKIVENLPHQVNVTEHVWIGMKDGVRLSARLWIPEGAENNPVPGILEYIPYRKGDSRRERDTPMHGYYAGHGYACARVDIRGSGDSEGVMTDEYTQQELEDGCEILKWMAARPWCDGNIGIIGISWGGFNGLQIAALQPPELKAIITVASTDDRYADDVHYMGGCLLNDNLSWASIMFAYNSLPPDPETVGDGWRDMWRQRLEGSGLWVENWMKQQTRGAFWKHGSVCENYDDIKCPVMAISGWADGYSNSVFRLMEHLKVPRQGLVGPWSHKYPHLGVPGPAISFMQESVRWWDHWLKGKNTGIMDDQPMVRVWMQEPIAPRAIYETRPGRWVGEASWPSPKIDEQVFILSADGRLTQDESQQAALTLQSPAGLGYYSGKWCSYMASPDLPADQRYEDGGALVFDSETLEEDVEILDAVAATLELESNEPVAMVAVRLSCINPDASATRVTYGILNLTHRDSHEHPEKLEPGKRYTVTVQLNEVAQRFARGCKIRIALSTSYWPLAWLPPKPVTLTFHTGGCRIMLPVRRPRKEDDTLPAYGAPEMGAPAPITELRPASGEWQVSHDLRSGTMMLEVREDAGRLVYEDVGLTLENKITERYSHRDGDFSSARGETLHDNTITRGDWHVHTIAHTVLTSDETHFHIKAKLDVLENESEIFSREWDLSIERNLL